MGGRPEGAPAWKKICHYLGQAKNIFKAFERNVRIL
jgi:hypothetical protein